MNIYDRIRFKTTTAKESLASEEPEIYYDERVTPDIPRMVQVLGEQVRRGIKWHQRKHVRVSRERTLESDGRYWMRVKKRKEGE